MTTRGAAAAVLVAVAVAGCSADADPRSLPPAPSVSPSPVVLPIPPEATPETAQGAAAFVEHYLLVLNRAFESGDASAVRSLTADGCGGCENLIGAVEAPPEPGERVEGGEYTLVFAEAPPVENGEVIVEMRYSLSEVRVYGADGRLLRAKAPERDIDAQMRLVRRADSWVVQGFRNVEA